MVENAIPIQISKLPQKQKTNKIIILPNNWRLSISNKQVSLSWVREGADLPKCPTRLLAEGRYLLRTLFNLRYQYRTKTQLIKNLIPAKTIKENKSKFPNRLLKTSPVSSFVVSKSLGEKMILMAQIRMRKYVES